MARFSRSWRLLQLLFPGAFEQGSPQNLISDVQPIWDAFRLGTLGETILRTVQLSNVSAGGDLHQVFGPEPAVNRGVVPIAVCCFHNSVVEERVDIGIEDQPTTLDQWGRWPASGGLVFAGHIFPASATRFGIWRAGCLPFYTKGSQLYAQWSTPTAGKTFVTNFFWLDVPGEVISILPFEQGNN